jgi:hypothetical protein
VTEDDWRLLSRRWRCNLTMEEADAFANVVRLYSTKAAVELFNHIRHARPQDPRQGHRRPAGINPQPHLLGYRGPRGAGPVCRIDGEDRRLAPIPSGQGVCARGSHIQPRTVPIDSSICDYYPQITGNIVHQKETLHQDLRTSRFLASGR